MIRDGMWATIAADLINAETSDMRPSVVFLNGEYWGIYNIRSRWTPEWIFEKYGVDNGAYDHLGYGHFTSSSVSLGANEGTTTEWTDLLTFIDNNDINTPGRLGLRRIPRRYRLLHRLRRQRILRQQHQLGTQP